MSKTTLPGRAVGPARAAPRRSPARQLPASGFGDILDQQTQQPQPTPQPPADAPNRDAERDRHGTGETAVRRKRRSPSRSRSFMGEPPPQSAPIETRELRRSTVPYAMTRGTFVRDPTFSDLGKDADVPLGELAEPAGLASPQTLLPNEGESMMPPIPAWGQSFGPEPELVQVETGEVTRVGNVVLEDAFTSLEGLSPLEELAEPFAPGFEYIEDAAAPTDAAANLAPEDGADVDFGPAFEPSAPLVPSVAMPAGSSDAVEAYTATGAPSEPSASEAVRAHRVEVFRSTLNRASISVDTDDGRIELAITTSGKHVMIEAHAEQALTDSIQRELHALRSALDRHDLELTDLSFGGGTTSDQPANSEASPHPSPHASQNGPPAPGSDEGFAEEGSETWVIPTGFRVVA